jgi:hypothetical protein
MQLTDTVAPPQPLDAPLRPDSRTFTVVWRTPGESMWKADVTADTATDAVLTVAYDQGISLDQVVGVLDRTTIR